MKNGNNNLTRLLTSGEVASLLGVTRERVLQLARAGRLRCRRTPGGARRFLRTGIERFIPRPPGRPRK